MFSRIVELFSIDCPVKSLSNRDGSLCATYPIGIILPEWFLKAKENLQKLNYEPTIIDDIVPGKMIDC